MPQSDYGTRIHEHVHAFFSGHTSSREDFDRGPIQSLIPGFHSIAVEPGPKTNLWTYVSCGAGLIEKANSPHMEFLILSNVPNPKHTERLAMTSFYHHTQTLGLGHTFPIGEPWVPGSTLDHGLISLPYPLGPHLEVLDTDSVHVHIYWILPITAAECAFKAENGLEALESAFEDAGLEYWDTRRSSIV